MSDSAAAQGYDPRWYEWERDYEAHHGWARGRRDLLRSILADDLADLRGETILGVGSGAGRTLDVFSEIGMRPIASDLMLPGLIADRGRTSRLACRLDALRLPFNESLPAIALLDVLEHLDDDSAAVHAAVAALQSGGALIVTAPALPTLMAQVDAAMGHRRRYELGALARLVESAGLRLARATCFGLLVLPFVWARRRTLTGRARSSDEIYQRELRVPPRVANMVIELSLRMEAAAARRVPLPWGLSALVVARKR